jgi:hypothetical protein
MHTSAIIAVPPCAARFERTSYTEIGTVMITNMPATNQAASRTQQQGHNTGQGSDIWEGLLWGIHSLPLLPCMLQLKKECNHHSPM